MTIARRRRCGVLLAGGLATRFGGVPKGLTPFGDGRLCDAALHALTATCDQVTVAANDPDAARWFPALRVVPDAQPGLGALGALQTALHAARHAAGDAITVVCAWDMPFVTAALLSDLVAAVDTGATACVPMHADGGAEPLCAAYGPGCAAVADDLLARGERSGHALLTAVGGVAWPVADRLTDADALRIFHNVNTRDDLARALAWLPSTPA